MKKLIAIILSAAVLCTALVACTKVNEKETTSAPPNTEASSTSTTEATEPVATTENTTEEPSSEEDTTEDTTEKTTESTTKKIRTTNPDTSISVNEALNYLTDFYGVPFSVNATIREDGIQYFKVIDKNGNTYARVSVDLDTSKMTETIVDTQEVNEYTIK